MKIQITDGELELMKVLWERSPLTLPELVAGVQQSNRWELGTIRTMLTRLMGKKAVEQSGERRGYRYKPLVGRKEYLDSASDNFIMRTFGGTRAMLSFFMERGKISPDDLAELERELERRNEK
ncbi:MAG: BlaI/MecI/CopY family transcriptional regulator [Victivallaceae bacterium]|nr:BlaI/MecI/CopY family transcriptional regulator [Victivallaceae bacterium]